MYIYDYSTKPDRLFTFMTRALVHLARWNLHIFDHSITALSQVGYAHL